MKISTKLKERFCKDCNIPLRLYKEPYFTDRINLYNNIYKTKDKWELFVRELARYNNEQEYFEEYNKVKDQAILFIKESEGFQRFNNEDMNKYRIANTGLPSKDIFKSSNDGKVFISVDMKKANFSALKKYDTTIFGNSDTWEGFISRFTDNEHIVRSKYIRQVILGNCNPRRQVTYTKYLMDKILSCLSKESVDRVAFFSNDEIVFDMSNLATCVRQVNVYLDIEETLQELDMEYHCTIFSLRKIHGTNGYIKKFFMSREPNPVELKCLNNYELPFVIRNLQEEEVTESDKVFYHEGLLAKFIEELDVGNKWN